MCKIRTIRGWDQSSCLFLSGRLEARRRSTKSSGGSGSWRTTTALCGASPRRSPSRPAPPTPTTSTCELLPAKPAAPATSPRPCARERTQSSRSAPAIKSRRIKSTHLFCTFRKMCVCNMSLVSISSMLHPGTAALEVTHFSPFLTGLSFDRWLEMYRFDVHSVSF